MHSRFTQTIIIHEMALKTPHIANIRYQNSSKCRKILTHLYTKYIYLINTEIIQVLKNNNTLLYEIFFLTDEELFFLFVIDFLYIKLCKA